MGSGRSLGRRRYRNARVAAARRRLHRRRATSATRASLRIPGGGAVHLDADGRLRRRSLVCRPARGQHQAGDLSLSALRQAPAGAGRAPARPTRGRPGTAPPRPHELCDARTACPAPAAARRGRAPPARMAVAAPATGDVMSPGPGPVSDAMRPRNRRLALPQCATSGRGESLRAGAC